MNDEIVGSHGGWAGESGLLERTQDGAHGVRPGGNEGGLDLGAQFVLSGQLDESLRWCGEGRRLFPDDPELLFHEGQVRRLKRQLAEAEACHVEPAR